jgi:hypothetical protein
MLDMFELLIPRSFTTVHPNGTATVKIKATERCVAIRVTPKDGETAVYFGLIPNEADELGRMLISAAKIARGTK